MRFETFERLKILAADHPDKIQTVTQKELDDMKFHEKEVNMNGSAHNCSVFISADTSLFI